MGDLESLAQNVEHPYGKEGKRDGREGTRARGELHRVGVWGVGCGVWGVGV